MSHHETLKSFLLRAGAATIAAFGVLSVAASAYAGDKHWKKGPPFVPPGHVYYYSAPPVVYVQRPVMVAPAPAIIYEREPVYYYRAPQPGMNLNINVPLR